MRSSKLSVTQHAFAHQEPSPAAKSHAKTHSGFTSSCVAPDLVREHGLFPWADVWDAEASASAFRCRHHFKLKSWPSLTNCLFKHSEQFITHSCRQMHPSRISPATFDFVCHWEILPAVTGWINELSRCRASQTACSLSINVTNGIPFQRAWAGFTEQKCGVKITWPLLCVICAPPCRWSFRGWVMLSAAAHIMHRAPKPSCDPVLTASASLTAVVCSLSLLS